MNEQQAEADRLRQQIAAANARFATGTESSQTALQQAVEEERKVAASERAALLAKVSALVNDSAATQEARMSGYLESANKRVKTSAAEYRTAQQSYDDGMDGWNAKSQALIDSSIKSRELIKAKLKSDWNNANEQTLRLTDTTKAVHGETVRIVDGQMAQMDHQLVALDEIVDRVRHQNEEHHKAHTASLGQLAGNVQESYQCIGQHFETSYARTKALDSEMQDRASALSDTLPALDANGVIRMPLQALRKDVEAAQIEEYSITGETPAKTQYIYPTALPRTEPHEALLNRMRGVPPTAPKSPQKSPRKGSPSKRASPSKLRSPTKVFASSPSKTATPAVFTDTPPILSFPARPQTATATVSHPSSLRELDVNIVPAPHPSVPVQEAEHTWHGGNVEDLRKPALLARSQTDSAVVRDLGGEGKKRGLGERKTMAEGRENLAPGMGNGGGGLGRRLRSRGSD